MDAPTGTQIVGAATELLVGHGFSSMGEIETPSGSIIRTFEDRLSVVGIAYFATWQGLDAGWIEAQGALVELMSDRLTRSDPKAWEGYLLLFTSDLAPDALAVDRVRRDTTRLRKLVTTGSELKSIAGVGDALLPVLPLELDGGTSDAERILDRLPQLLEPSGIDPGLARRVVIAYEANRSPMEEIWNWRSEQ
jgi:hypothetical protein